MPSARSVRGLPGDADRSRMGGRRGGAGDLRRPARSRKALRIAMHMFGIEPKSLAALSEEERDEITSALYGQALVLAPFGRLVGGTVIPVHDLAEKDEMFKRISENPPSPTCAGCSRT